MGKIILHSTGCPKCAILKKKLEIAKIDFEINAQVDKMQQLGITSVPVLEVEGKLLQFRDAIIYVNNFNKGE